MNPNKDPIFVLIMVLVMVILFVSLKFGKEIVGKIENFDWCELLKPDCRRTEKEPHVIDKSFDIGVIFNLHITDESYEIGDNGYYYLIANSGKFTSSMIIGTKTETIEENLEIPNRMNGEYARLRLEQHDNGSIYLISEERIKFGENDYSNIDIKSEISFIEGNWDTFLSGGNIVMRYTEHSLKDLASLMENFFEKKLSSASVCEGHCSNFSFTAKKISNATITINKKMIRMKYDGPSEITGSIKVKVSKVHNQSSIPLAQATRGSRGASICDRAVGGTESGGFLTDVM